MTSPQHISLSLQSILDGLSNALPDYDPQDVGETAELVRKLGDLRTTLEKEGTPPHLADVSAVAIQLVDEIARNGLVGPKETMDVVERIVALVRAALGLSPSQARARTAGGEAPRGKALKLLDGQRLGELLVTLSMLTPRDVEAALELQKTTGMLLGEALVERGVLTKESVQAVLRLQEARRRRNLGEPWRGPLRAS
jgi:hypothetical protein